MAKYRKRAIVVDAFQFPADDESLTAFHEWCDSVGLSLFTSERKKTLAIDTLEGTMTAGAGDWIIKGVKGEFYPCKDDIFRATYEAVDLPAPDTPPIGPRRIVLLTCNGCPAYKTEYWKKQLENDETDTGTSSECTAANRGITCYAEPLAPVPPWCPKFNEPV